MKTHLLKFIVIVFTIMFVNLFLLPQDSEAQWTQSNYNLFGKNISTMKASGDTLFLGTYGNGVLYSTNSGNNWTQTTLNSQYVYAIAVNNSTIYAACGTMYISTNRGTNWTAAGLGSAYSVLYYGNTLFAGVDQNGVYLSTNNGVNWIQTSLNNRTIYSFTACGGYIFAGSQNYGVYVSSNNGISWSQTALTNGMIRSLFVSGTNLYAGDAMSNGVSLSTNYGVNWTGIGLSMVYSFSLSGGYLFAGTYNGVYRTSNNGASWTQTPLTKYVTSMELVGSTIFAGTQNGYYTTTNNGQNWMTPPPSSVLGFSRNGNNIYAGSNDGVFLSTDGGVRWNYKNLSNYTISILYDSGYVFAGTGGSGVYYTTNDGVNWVQTSMTTNSVNSLVKKDSYLLAATSSNGVFYSTNKGTNWIQSSLSGITTYSLYLSDSAIFAGTSFGGAYISTNKGVNWTQTSLMYMDVNSFNSNGGRLYAGTPSGVYYTTNNGTNWTQTSLTTNTIVSFTNYGSSIFAGTNGAGVYLTKNAGVNWTQVNDGMGSQGVNALTTYGNYVVAGTGSGSWRRYILEFAPIRGDANLDSTVNVLDVTSDVSYILGNNPTPFSVLAADINTDLVVNVLDIVGTVNIILHPTFKPIAGKEHSDSPESANLFIQNNNLKLTNTSRVAGIQFKLSGAGSSTVTFTPSSELTYYQIASGSTSESSKTFIIFTMSDSSLGMGVHTLGTFSGLNSGITITEVFISDENGNGVITSGGENGQAGIPKDYSLSQNYPNPFNPVTMISFQLPKSGFTNLKIYDVTGKLVKTLVNEIKQAGYYKIEFDASSLSSGVYFYKLSSGDFIIAKKMIVLK